MAMVAVPVGMPAPPQCHRRCWRDWRHFDMIASCADDLISTIHTCCQQGSDAEDDFAEPDGGGKPAGGTKAVKAKTKQKPLPPGSLCR